MSKRRNSIYEAHSESSIVKAADLMIRWEAILLSGRRKPNDPSRKNSSQDLANFSDCPKVEANVWDSYEYRGTIDKINSALERIFLLRDTDEHDLGRVLDKFKPEDDF